MDRMRVLSYGNAVALLSYTCIPVGFMFVPVLRCHIAHMPYLLVAPQTLP